MLRQVNESNTIFCFKGGWGLRGGGRGVIGIVRSYFCIPALCCSHFTMVLEIFFFVAQTLALKQPSVGNILKSRNFLNKEACGVNRDQLSIWIEKDET